MPIEVSDWLEPVAACLADMDADAARKGGGW